MSVLGFVWLSLSLGCGADASPPRSPSMPPTSAAQEQSPPTAPPPWRVSVPDLEWEPSIRVLIAETSEPVTISGDGLSIDGETATDRLVVSLVDGALSDDGDHCGQSRCSFEATEGVRVAGRGVYPGRLELLVVAESMLVVAELQLESYVAGVVSGEIPGRWGLEVKKAQAIAARSYALVQLLRRTGPYTVVSTSMDQVYRPQVNTTAVTAAAETRGEVLVTGDVLVEAFYHSTCGGHTENPAAIWPQAAPWRWSTSCATCAASPRYRWDAQLSAAQLVTAATDSQLPFEAIEGVELGEHTPSGRVGAVTLAGGDAELTLGATAFRRMVGTRVVPSTHFEVEKMPAGSFGLSGRGFGHGVGMCQWGAHGLAETGTEHAAVLQHYYRGTQIEQLYD